jgi:phosphotransferase system HPr (HPr) family protein
VPSRTVILPNPTGLHARPARVFAKAAAEYTADVTVSKDGEPVNAKSVLMVLTLDCHQGDEVTINAEGADADEAIEQLSQLIESGLGE